ncbi:hypothetical protein GOBAR_DD31599 [Gossypium barbadense]|nr:hypothetical protein GOBAR_DD31599 [Gossypium barbadense]
MAAIKVHGSPMSTATQRVLACLHEKGTDFQFVPINMAAGEHKSENYLSLNWISYSLENRYFVGGQNELKKIEGEDKGTQLLIPGSNKDMAVLELWKEVEAHQFDSPSSKIAWEAFYKPFFGMVTDSAAVEENEGKLAKVLDVYEARLTQSKYLASDCFTLADLHHIPNIQCLLATPAKKLIDSRPHVCAWVKEITARPAWSKVCGNEVFEGEIDKFFFNKVGGEGNRGLVKGKDLKQGAKMRLVGLTGGIASGKSTVSSMFKHSHIPVVDADIVARDALKKNSGGYKKVVAAFGPDILQDDGQVDRLKLGRIVFSDASKRQLLNRLLAPYISSGIFLEILKLWLKGHKVIILDIPLLFEAKMDKWTKPIVVVWVDPETQLRRLMERDNSTEEDARNRINAQMSLDLKKSQADIVIDNTGSRQDLQERFSEVLSQVKRPLTWTEFWLSRDGALTALLGVIIGTAITTEAPTCGFKLDHRSRYLFVATAGLLGSHQAEEISLIVVEKYFSSLGSIKLLAADYFL